MEIPSSSVVSRQTYDAATLAGPLSNQMAALKAAGRPGRRAGHHPGRHGAGHAARPRSSGYSPQYVVDSVGADPPTVGPLLSSFTQKGGALGGAGAGGGRPAERGHHDGVLRTRVGHVQPMGAGREEDSSSSTRRRCTPSPGLDGNTQYGVALAYTFVQALQKAGKNLTRQSLLNAIDKTARASSHPASCPLSYSSSVHFGFEGEEVIKLESSAPAGGDADGQLDRRRRGQPGRGDEPGIGTDQEVHRPDQHPAQEPVVDVVRSG